MCVSASNVRLLAAALFVSAALSHAASVEIQTLAAGAPHDALFAVAFSGSAGAAVGAGGELLETGDAGKTWTAVAPPPTVHALLGIAIEGDHAIAVGQQGTILLKSGSSPWAATKSGTDARLFAVSLNKAGRAVAVGAFGTALKSEDGGKTWSSIAPKWADFNDQGADPHVYGVKVDAAGAITLVGEFGLILRSNDDGAMWVAQHKGDASLFALDLRDDGNGYAVGQDGTVLRTADDGKTWTAVDAGSKSNLLGVVSGAGTVYITGMHEILASTDDGQSWGRPGESADTSGWMTGVAMAADSTSAVAVGNGGRIVRLGK